MAILLMAYGPAPALNLALEACPHPALLYAAVVFAEQLIIAAISLGLCVVLTTMIAIETRIRTKGHDLAVALQSAASVSPTATVPGVTTSQ